MKLKRLVLLAALGSTFILPNAVHAQEGIVYYPTYRDGSAHVYTYNPWVQFEINAQVGRLLDIQLRPNETLQKVASGNTTQWVIDTDEVAGIHHVYIKPMVSGIKTNFIINTSERSYRLIVNSVSDGEYIVLWTYPKEDAEDNARLQEEAIKREQEEAARWQAISNMHYDNNFKVIKNKNVQSKYVPKTVFTDGAKTYIELTDAIKDNMPTVFYFDDWDKSKVQLVNYRLKGNVMEIDKVMSQFKIVYSQQSYLVVSKIEDKKVIPKANEIVFGSVDSNTVYKATTLQQDAISMQTEFISLKERMHKKKIEETKAFIKDTQAPKANPEEEQRLLEQIKNLEEDLGINKSTSSTEQITSIQNENKQSDNNFDPMIQAQINELYKS